MRRAAGAILLAALVLSGAADAQRGRDGGGDGERGGDRGRRGGPMRGYADPAAVIQAEIAVGQLALQKGQWAALAKMAGKGAVLLAPGPVLAERWLRGRPPAIPPARLNTHFVFLSCDGASALTTGTWSRPDGAKGWYRAVWQRGPKNGPFQWLLAAAGPLDRPGEEPDAISARGAHCARRGPAERGPEGAPGLEPALALDPKQPLPAEHEQRSPDGSLRWRWSASHGLEGWMATEAGEDKVLPAPSA